MVYLVKGDDAIQYGEWTKARTYNFNHIVLKKLLLNVNLASFSCPLQKKPVKSTMTSSRTGSLNSN